MNQLGQIALWDNKATLNISYLVECVYCHYWYFKLYVLWFSQLNSHLKYINKFINQNYWGWIILGLLNIKQYKIILILIIFPWQTKLKNQSSIITIRLLVYTFIYLWHILFVHFVNFYTIINYTTIIKFILFLKNGHNIFHDTYSIFFNQSLYLTILNLT